MLRRFLCTAAAMWAVSLFAAAPAEKARAPELLDSAVMNWLDGKEEWAFTQRIRTLDDDGKVKEEQVTRYDPSLPDNRRWQLLEWNGRAPTPEKRAAWEKAKNSKPRKRVNKPIDELFDLAKAVEVKAAGGQTVFQVPVRQSAARLAQVDKLDVEVAVGTGTKAIERVRAGIREPMRVAFGLATVIGLDLDMSFDPSEPAGARGSVDEPEGTAKASVAKLGDLLEYEWYDFKRVEAYKAPAGRR